MVLTGAPLPRAWNRAGGVVIGGGGTLMADGGIPAAPQSSGRKFNEYLGLSMLSGGSSRYSSSLGVGLALALVRHPLPLRIIIIIPPRVPPPPCCGIGNWRREVLA